MQDIERRCGQEISMKKISEYSFAIDVETLGLCPMRDSVISLGLVVLDDTLKVIDTTYLKVRPELYKQHTEDNVATHVHGFKLNEMIFFPERRDQILNLMRFLKKYLCPLHNTRPLFYHALKGFDYLFLEWLFRKENLEYSLWKVFDHPNTYSTVLLGRSLGYEGNSLDKWAMRMNENFNHHNALDDAKMCVKILQYALKNHFNNDVELFFEHLQRMKTDDRYRVQEVQTKENAIGLFNV